MRNGAVMKFLERIFNHKKDDKKKEEPGRNDNCWCGSGKKYKRCHLEKDKEKKRRQGGLA
jgi:uncharacterized protein YecA (UPF0149 family)